MWKFKNRKEPLEETTEATAIIERQSVDVEGDCNGNGDGGSDVDKQNNDSHDYSDPQRNASSNTNTETIDAFLAKELNALSFQQVRRER